jgi:hypothetical protein
MDLHRDHIDLILSEQAKIIKSGKIMGSATRRRGRPAGSGRGRARGEGGRRPGRQPVIIRESSLDLKPRAQARLGKYLSTVSDGSQLGKDATVFAVAFFLCTEVLNKDTFTAGDVIAAINQLGQHPAILPAESIDVVQMLRNLAAASIGKEWVSRNSDGTFALTPKGRAVGESGAIIRPRGRRPAEGDKPAAAPKAGTGQRGRPRKNAQGPEKGDSNNPGKVRRPGRKSKAA